MEEGRQESQKSRRNHLVSPLLVSSSQEPLPAVPFLRNPAEWCQPWNILAFPKALTCSFSEELCVPSWELKRTMRGGGQA